MTAQGLGSPEVNLPSYSVGEIVGHSNLRSLTVVKPIYCDRDRSAKCTADRLARSSLLSMACPTRLRMNVSTAGDIEVK